jgi:hypothetical protein
MADTFGATYQVVASIAEGTIKSWTHIPHVQPSIMMDEFFECENTLKNDPGFQEALRKHGITDFSLLMVDPWSAIAMIVLQRRAIAAMEHSAVPEAGSGSEIMAGGYHVAGAHDDRASGAGPISASHMRLL